MRRPGAPRAELRLAADVLVADYMNVRRGEDVLISVDTATDVAAAEAVFASVLAAGARPVTVEIPQLPFQGKLGDAFVPKALGAAVRECQVWIDLTFPYMAGSEVHDQAMKTGRIRYLLAGDLKAGGIERLFGGVDLDDYQRAFDGFSEVLTKPEGQKIRVTDTLGSDVTFRLGKSAYAKPRRAVEPGTYLVPGSCTMFPDMESVRGVIRTAAGFHEFFTPFESPITIEVDGKVRSVTGGGSDRLVLDRCLRRAGGGDYGYVIHFTFAMHPTARSTGSSFIEDSRVMGANAVGLGLPWWVPGGGENHPDVVLTEQSIWVEDVLVIDGGVAVAPDELVAAAGFLRTKADVALARHGQSDSDED
ncbi:MAG: hypothetical protein WD341_13790 [Tistlia sp.]|uniref:hypothetical protein n=1 Tax=Tistlia sp. TaxID=3057121 RepID=UPI0034A20009